ncbi:outer membrane murein-binding lipoprotein Lpp [Curtobacterium pusillum]|uniref:Outer membrane murein-binding lipoprotein Lpp n=1 Tax=Curtobacterium pusillum TaxID=69373 RepID=A0AAW3T847_9MICO|nr:hypothetical protein [Curtobacterium pusillum]MBA8990803.1 outer membrane murein-binding lipoprotein Lpp [Curtobacterium pusillum]
MNPSNRRILALMPAILAWTILAGCSNNTAAPQEQEPSMSTTGSSDAKQVWKDADAQAEATQAILPGRWLSTDSAAGTCGTGGVRWGVSRIGPGTSKAGRAAKVEEVEENWRSLGWKPMRSELTGDAPGLQVRYPAKGVFEDGFFAEFATTEHASTLQIQTPCTPGDADQLNREKYAEKHTNTPPDIPGASTPSTSATH